MDKDLFLSKAKHSSSFISESKILSKLSELDKAIIISMDDLEYFNKYYMQIKDSVEKIKKSRFYHIEMNDKGICQVQDIDSREISEAQIINYVKNEFENFTGYCFVVNSGMQYLYKDGKIDHSIMNCLQKTKSMKEKLEILKPVSSIKEVFEHFKIECKYSEDYYNRCFDVNEKKVKEEIKEQELRNILMLYLAKQMQGEVAVEFCTDYFNDEESVDIYLNDGIQRAIIEVKFALTKKYYAGSTFYSVGARTGDAIRQLDKYAKHLSKDARLVDFGYVYMFYINDLKDGIVNKRIEESTEKAMSEVSNDLYSIFEGVETNNMKCWGSAC